MGSATARANAMKIFFMSSLTFLIWNAEQRSRRPPASLALSQPPAFRLEQPSDGAANERKSPWHALEIQASTPVPSPASAPTANYSESVLSSRSKGGTAVR